MENRNRNTGRRSVFDKLSEKLFALLAGGLFGYFFTSYDEANMKYQKRVKRKRRVRSYAVRRKVSKTIEKSFFVNVIPKFVELMFRTSTRDYGITMLVMGAVTTVLYPLRSQILFIEITEFTFLTGIIICLCSIPLLVSSKTLAQNIYTSKISNGILFKFLGLDKDRMRAMSEKDRHSSANLSLLFGFLLGILAYFIEPVNAILILLLAVLAYTTLKTPEIGTVMVIFAIPFLDAYKLCIGVAYVFACYLIKCLIGKRTFKFEYLDVFVVLAMFMLLLRGAISKDVASTSLQALVCVCFALSYFLITNLIKSKEWFRRCAIALALSGAIVAITAVLQIIIGKISIYVPMLEKIYSSEESARATFESPETLGLFLLTLVPFALIRMISERKGSKKFVGFMLLALLMTAISFTSSLAAVIGAVCAILLLLIIYHRNYMYLALVVVAAVPTVYFTLPDDIMAKLGEIKMLGSFSFGAYVEEFRHAFDLFFQNPFGIGMGEQVLTQVHGEEQSYINSLSLQMLIEQGVINFVVIFTLFVMIARMTFSYCVHAKNKYRRINCGAGFCSTFGIVMAGTISYVFLDQRIYLLVWVLVAVSFAYMRIEREDAEPRYLASDFTIATLDITLTKVDEHENVPKRKYVHMPKAKRLDDQGDAKEFDEDEEEAPNDEDSFVINEEPEQESIEEVQEQEALPLQIAIGEEQNQEDEE